RRPPDHSHARRSNLWRQRLEGIGSFFNMSTTPRFRLGFFSYLQGKGTQAEIYEQTLELFLAAEELGFDAGWVAQHHFGRLGGLPSPLVFFSALAARTQRLMLGTAIISLPLEQPIRLAEDAAVFETLYPGRLQ